jgi:hypothetical protein
MVLFTAELAIRFVCAPCWREFVFDFYNVIDLLSIVPFYAEIGTRTTTTNVNSLDNHMLLTSIRTLRLIRITRIVRVSRHSASIQIFVNV